MHAEIRRGIAFELIFAGITCAIAIVKNVRGVKKTAYALVPGMKGVRHKHSRIASPVSEGSLDAAKNFSFERTRNNRIFRC